MKLIIIILSLVLSLSSYAQEIPVEVVIWKDDKRCSCKKANISLKTSTKEVTVAFNGNRLLIPYLEQSEKGKLIFNINKAQFIFNDVNTNLRGTGEQWVLRVDYPPIDTPEYLGDKRVKWLYTLDPGNGALITEYRFTKPPRFRCKKYRP